MQICKYYKYVVFAYILQILHANTTPFYVRDLSIREFWYSQGSWNPTPQQTQRDGCTSWGDCEVPCGGCESAFLLC